MSADLDDLRRDMRTRRRALSAGERERAGWDVAQTVARHIRAGRGTRVAAYLSVGSELPTGPLLALANERGWQVFVPAVVSARNGRMRFVPLSADLRLNRFGIPEPLVRAADGAKGWIDARWLDLAFLPLLAAGPHGERLGSGAGFYDRAFAFLRGRAAWRKPPLIGLAYELQRVPALTRSAWDVPLDALVTERGLYRFSLSANASRNAP